MELINRDSMLHLGDKTCVALLFERGKSSELIRTETTPSEGELRCQISSVTNRVTDMTERMLLSFLKGQKNRIQRKKNNQSKGETRCLLSVPQS